MWIIVLCVYTVHWALFMYTATIGRQTDRQWNKFTFNSIKNGPSLIISIVKLKRITLRKYEGPNVWAARFISDDYCRRVYLFERTKICCAHYLFVIASVEWVMWYLCVCLVIIILASQLGVCTCESVYWVIVLWKPTDRFMLIFYRSGYSIWFSHINNNERQSVSSLQHINASV